MVFYMTQILKKGTHAFYDTKLHCVHCLDFPSINVSISYSKYTNTLDKYYEKNYPDFPKLRDQIKKIYSSSEELEQVVQLVGAQSLADNDKVTLFCAGMIKDDFLQQNGYSKYDAYCPVWKSNWMMKAMMSFHDEAQKAVAAGVSWSHIKEATADLQHQLRSMKFEVSNHLLGIPIYIPISIESFGIRERKSRC